MSPSARLVAACLLAFSACHKAPPPVVSPPPPSAARTTQLQLTIDRILASPELARGSWGVVVKSLERGDTLYAFNAQKLLMPASTLKVLTLAVAADQLGWDFRFHTRLTTVGSIENGVLDGDLMIVGSGDPSIDDWDGAATQLFDQWAAALKHAGVNKVLGRIIGNDNVFDDEGLGNGWAWDDLGASYATNVAGLQFNQNAVRVIVGPGSSIGEPAEAFTQPAQTPLTLINHATTADAADAASLSIRRLPFTPTLDVRGTVRVTTPPVSQNVSVSNPTLYFVSAARDAFVAQGIEVIGAAVDIDDLTSAPDLGRASTIADHESPPLSDLAATMMRLSQNLYAETLVKTLAARSDTIGSTAAGLEVIRSTLARWNVAEDFLIVDGSGLSRYNLMAPDAIVAVLKHVYQDPKLRDQYLATLPVAAMEGTLAQRMQGTAAAGRVHAKTGSFSNARALAGFVTTQANEPLAFAIIANNYGTSTQVIDRATDAIVVALAEQSRR